MVAGGLSARALAEGGAEAGVAGRGPDRSQGARGRLGPWGKSWLPGGRVFDLFALAFRARWLAPSNSRMMLWCTSRSMAAMVVMGSLKICPIG